MLILFLITAFLFFFLSSNLLLSLILLEILGFVVLCAFSSVACSWLSSDFLCLYLFSVLVMEGVMCLSGLITLVSFTGSDSVSSSSLINC